MTAQSAKRRRMPPPVDLAQYGMLGFIVLAALAGSFTHMHDWTIREIDAALVARGLDAHTPEWFGWANAVTSELMPTSAFLSIQQRKRQGRPAGMPSMIFAGSFVVSIFAQLSATGIDLPLAAEFLAMLPALAVLIMSKVIFGDIEHAGKVAELQRRKSELATEQAAELERQRERDAAELDRQRERDAAELSCREAERAAELTARLAREARDHEAEIERARVAAEQAGITERARITATAERARIDAEERERARRAETERIAAVEAARIKAEAEADAVRLAAEVEARARDAESAAVKAQAERTAAASAALAAASTGRGSADHEEGGDTAGRQRRTADETQGLVDAILAALPTGTARPSAVAAVVAQLSVTPEYARRFVPAGWIKGGSSGDGEQDGAGGSAGRRHLAVVSAG